MDVDQNADKLARQIEAELRIAGVDTRRGYFLDRRILYSDVETIEAPPNSKAVGVSKLTIVTQENEPVGNGAIRVFQVTVLDMGEA